MPALEFDVEVHNKRVLRALDLLEQRIPQTVNEEIEVSVKRAQQRVIFYPPELPGQRYVRTGIYGESWVVVPLLGDEVGWALGGDAEQDGRNYTIYVGGDAMGRRQAAIHQGRWNVAREEIDDEVKDLPVRVVDPLQQAIDGVGL